MFDFWKRKRKATEPETMVPIGYHSLPRPLQDAYNYPWGYQVSYTNRMGTNAWFGNQLPGMSNFIPGVPESYSPWYIQRNLQLAGNYQLSRSANGTVGQVGSVKANELAQQQGAYWQGLQTVSSYWGIAQGGEM